MARFSKFGFGGRSGKMRRFRRGPITMRQMGRSAGRIGRMRATQMAHVASSVIEQLDPDELFSAGTVGDVARLLAKAETDALTRVTADRTQIVTFGTVLNLFESFGEQDDIFDQNVAGVERVWGLKPNQQTPYNPIAVRSCEAILSIDGGEALTGTFADQCIAQVAQIFRTQLRTVVSGGDDQELPIGAMLNSFVGLQNTETLIISPYLFDLSKNVIHDPAGLDLISDDDAIQAYINDPLLATVGAKITDQAPQTLTLLFTCEAL